jgi:membrane-bound lytic murein transglycosylase B
MEKRVQWIKNGSKRRFSGPAAFTVFLALTGCASTGPGNAADRPITSPGAAAVTPDEQVFADFIKDFRAEALRAGVTAETYDKATAGIHINERVKTLNENQPEFTRQVWDYLSGAVSDWRVTRGKEVLGDNASLFRSIQRKYSVPKEVVAAVWGLESAYGRDTGSFNIFEALATLAYHGPRTAFGREQLIAAMKIMQQEKLEPSQMTSSWAGAIGHTQFVPTTFLLHAVDGDGDGVRNLWNAPDALASAANYLKVSGWQAGERWGQEVQLPDGFAYEDCDVDTQKPISEWVARGVRTATGEPLTPSDTMAAIFLPAGYKGPAFLVRQNFRTILTYNAATSYALAISLLSDRLKGGGNIVAAWPRSELPLTKDQRLQLQEGLNALGYDAGTADGVLGRKTRAALRSFQKARNLPADGFATRDMLARVMKDRDRGG